MSETTNENPGEPDTKGHTDEFGLPPPVQPTHNRSRAGIILLTLLALLALVLAAGGTTLGYIAWQDLQVRLSASERASAAVANTVGELEQRPGIDVARQEMQGIQSELNANIQNVQQSLEALKKENQTLSEAVNKAYEQATRTERGWVLAEIEHLLRMANYRLRLERDFEGAIAALQAADSRLHDLSDPRLLSIREQLADELYALKHYPHPDPTGILLTLDRLATGLRPFPADVVEASIVPASHSQTDKPVEGAEPPTQTGWQDVFTSLRAGLDKHISITNNDQVKSLTEEYEKQQRGNQFLQQRLSAARFAVISRDEKDYHRQLDSAIAWIGANSDSSQAESLKDDLMGLNGQTIQPELPDISKSLVMLQSLDKPADLDGAKQ